MKTSPFPKVWRGDALFGAIVVSGPFTDVDELNRQRPRAITVSQRNEIAALYESSERVEMPPQGAIGAVFAVCAPRVVELLECERCPRLPLLAEPDNPSRFLLALNVSEAATAERNGMLVVERNVTWSDAFGVFPVVDESVAHRAHLSLEWTYLLYNILYVKSIRKNVRYKTGDSAVESPVPCH